MAEGLRALQQAVAQRCGERWVRVGGGGEGRPRRAGMPCSPALFYCM